MCIAIALLDNCYMKIALISHWNDFYLKATNANISNFQGGGRKRLPKFIFSAKFPIGLHVIL